MAQDHRFRDDGGDDGDERPPALQSRLQLHLHLLLTQQQRHRWFLTHLLTRHYLRPCAYGDHGHRDDGGDVADHLGQAHRHQRWTRQLTHSQLLLIQCLHRN